MDGLVVINKNSKCNFCGFNKNDNFKYGPIYKLGNIKAHYYCVLLSNTLIQNGDDNEGLLGFLLPDIQRELKRTLNIFCVYCKKGNATITCAFKKCKKNFHLPCGLESGSLHQFTDQFKSFCHVHRPIQSIPDKILKEASKAKTICCICYDKVNVRDKNDTLWAPCCLKTWYHRYCAQKLAHNEGYFFRCAICNNDQKFNKWMQRFGIFVPQQDASWELVPNAYEELLFRYSKCDAEKCKCPDGRHKNTENTRWEIVLCESCGSQGMHVACGNLKFVDPEWECSSCQKITNRMKSAIKVDDAVQPDEGSSKLLNLAEVCRKKRRRGSEDLENFVLDKRKKCRSNKEEKKNEEKEIEVIILDEDSEEKNDTFSEALDKSEELVDVETEVSKFDFQEVLTQLKPGPLSYKLAILQNICGNSLISLEKPSQGTDAKTISPDIDLIVLSDSDEENEEKDLSSIAEGKKTERLTKISQDREKVTFSLENIDVVCAFQLPTMEKPGDGVNKFILPLRTADDNISYTDLNPQSSFSSSIERLPSGRRKKNLQHKWLSK